MRRPLALLIALAGCRLHFDALGGDADDGGNSGGDGAAPPACNAITRLSDDFEDGAYNEHLWDGAFADPGTSYAEASGDLVLTLASNTADVYAGYKSSVAMDLREQRIVTQISGTPAAPATMGLRIQTDDFNNGVTLGTEGSMLYARKTVAGVFSMPDQIPFDAAMHRYWAFSEHAGTLTWEWSQDGVTFTPLYSEPSPIDVSFVYVVMFAGTPTAIATPGTARFASFNQGVTAQSSSCSATTFIDTFDDGATGIEWFQVPDPCCTDTETAGGLVLSSTGTAMGTAQRRSAWGLDLRGSAIGVTVVEAPTLANQTGYFTAYYDSLNQLQLRVSAANITVRTIVGGTPTNSLYAVPPPPFHLRIREAGGIVFFEVSTNKQVGWNTLQMMAAPFPVDDVRISLAYNAAALTVDHIKFDDLNVP